MSEQGHKVAIITGGSQGIGAGLVAAYRRRDWAVVANSRTIKPSEDGAVLTISGDISQPATTDRIIGEALDRFGRIDTLINNAGIFIAKPFTDYTADDYRGRGRRRQLPRRSNPDAVHDLRAHRGLAGGSPASGSPRLAAAGWGRGLGRSPVHLGPASWSRYRSGR